MNVEVTFHFRDEQAQTDVLNLEAMRKKNVILKEFADRIEFEDEEYLEITHDVIDALNRASSVYVSLPAQVDFAIDVYEK